MERESTIPAAARNKAGNAQRSRRSDAPTIPRDRILHAAARLFHERGYKGTTVRDIADAVGILSGSLFHHFRSKEEMLLEIMREAAMTLCIRAEEVVSRTSSPMECLQQFIDIELEWMVTDVKKDYLAVLIFEWRDVPEAAKPEFTRLRKRYFDLWMDVLEDYSEAVPLCVPVNVATRILHDALVGAMTWFRMSGRYSAQEFRDMLIKLVQA
jgi:AcrR family transcriptional regulator